MLLYLFPRGICFMICSMLNYGFKRINHISTFYIFNMQLDALLHFTEIMALD